jgi:hypothetical protein
LRIYVLIGWFKEIRHVQIRASHPGSGTSEGGVVIPGKFTCESAVQTMAQVLSVVV